MSDKHPGYTATQDDDVGLEKIDDIAEPVGEQFDRFADNLDGDGILRGRRPCDKLAGDVLRRSSGQVQKRGLGIFLKLLARPPSDCRPGGQKFDAASLAARASRAVKLNSHVAGFGRRSGAPVIDLAVEYDSGADPGADGGVKHVVMTLARAPQN